MSGKTGRKGGRRPSPPKRDASWMVRHVFVYDGKEVKGIRRLAIVSDLTEGLIRHHADKLRAGVDVKPVLDKLAEARRARDDDPNVGEDGRSKKITCDGKDFLSKKALALHLAEEMGVPWKTAQKHLWRVPAGGDATEVIAKWRSEVRRAEKIEETHARTGVPKGVLAARYDANLDIEVEAERHRNAVGHVEKATRRKTVDWSRTRIQDEFPKWPEAVKKLSNLDLTLAKVYRTGDNPNVKVSGLRCMKCEADIPRDPWVNQLRKGQQPCPGCQSNGQRGSWSARTIERLRQIIVDKEYLLDASEASLVRASELGVTSSDKYVKGLRCTKCTSMLEITPFTLAAKGEVPCPTCDVLERFELAKQRVLEVHKGTIEIKRFGGTMGSRSIFRCTQTWCGHEWPSRVDVVIGPGNKQHPSRCPKCRRKHLAEAYIEDTLRLQGVEHESQFRVEATVRDGKAARQRKTLYADFYVPQRRLVIEHDGDQHYDPHSHYARLDSFEDIRARDDAKVDAFAAAGIEVVRIPPWCDLRIELAAILAGNPTYVGKPADAERKRDELGIKGRRRKKRGRLGWRRRSRALAGPLPEPSVT